MIRMATREWVAGKERAAGGKFVYVLWDLVMKLRSIASKGGGNLLRRLRVAHPKALT